MWLAEDIQDSGDDCVKQNHPEARQRVIEMVKHEYGEHLADAKVQNFADLGGYPFSVVSYHTDFLVQIRRSFVGFGYYPALTGACALGERILNHLLLRLRDHYRNRPEYKRVCRKGSFDEWSRAIDVLECWNVLLPESAALFRELHKLRNEVIHFRPELESDTRTPALRAIRLVKDIVGAQFAAIGVQPWFIRGTPGESYIKKEAEDWPFVRQFYLPACEYVGPYHEVTEIMPYEPIRVADRHVYEERDISDEEFVALRFAHRAP